MNLPHTQSNTAAILSLVGAEIAALLLYVGVCEVRARDLALCEGRWALALPAIALAGQSAATYFMDSGRSPGPGWPGGGPAGGPPDSGQPGAVVRALPPRNRRGQFRTGNQAGEGSDALAG
ncbi:hypothetical protein NZK33_11460 [Cyanobium sp. FGCU-6]|nr:hypothetical protein [Cyanobium sp. FGCU6]